MNRFLTFLLVLTILLPATKSFAEEKSMWQKFVDFFNPSPTLEGEGPLYDELKKLDSQISKTEGKYSRERRPGNKARLKKELEDLREQRDKLVERIKAGETGLSSSSTVKSAPTSAVQAKQASSAQTKPASSAQAAPATAVCAHDTVYVRDTVVIHDTLYVIVADKPAAAPADTTQEPNKN